MTELREFPDGGYRFLPGVAPYSAGIVAAPGFEIERVRFDAPIPVEEGFRRIKTHLAALGRPPAAFCACELRSPEPFSEAGFTDFNRGYVSVLERWGIVRDGTNPVARSNVCPELDPPAVPGFFAFSYTVPGSRGGFVVAGSGEAPEGRGNYRDHIVRRGDLSQEGLREKARWVLGEQERRLRALGFGWGDVSAVQVYTVHDVFPWIGEELVARRALRGGLTWHLTRPPVVDIDFEMDCRSVALERVL
ncbi:MAG TPA: hypothetical protein VNM14_19650 [Planctomycetota bacterium]|jgi:hypothetical protein|nr:hypothetical protein [Planctomycetota bacterium]